MACSKPVSMSIRYSPGFGTIIGPIKLAIPAESQPIIKLLPTRFTILVAVPVAGSTDTIVHAAIAHAEQGLLLPFSARWSPAVVFRKGFRKCCTKSEVLIVERQSAFDLIMHVSGDADATGRREAFQSSGDIDAVAIYLLAPTITSPRLTPMRNSIRRSRGASAFSVLRAV